MYYGGYGFRRRCCPPIFSCRPVFCCRRPFYGYGFGGYGFGCRGFMSGVGLGLLLGFI